MSNTLESCLIEGPYGKVEECSKFTIDTPTFPFVLHDILTPGRGHAFSCWLKSETEGNVTILGVGSNTTTSWTKCTRIFGRYNGPGDLRLKFTIPGTYYIYHPQLELGTKTTDWTPAPEDVDEAVSDATSEALTAQDKAESIDEQVKLLETRFQMLADSISMLVRSGESGTLVKQDANGFYYFDISDIEDSLSSNASELESLEGIVLDANGKIDVLASTSEALRARTEYIRSYTNDDDQPCLELGEGDSTFKVYITNTEIRFSDGMTVPAYITNQNGVTKLMIEKAEVKGELQIGDFVWKRRDNRNVGLMWIGGNV